MKIFGKKTMIATIALILTLAFSISLTLLPAANAHKPPWEITSYAYVVAAPNPVGVGQSASVVMWVDGPLPGASLDNDVRRHNYKLTIKSPDGNNKTVEWPAISDSTSIQFYQFKPDQVGTYTLYFEYAGQVYTWSETRQMRDWTNDVFLPDSSTTTLTVQEEPIPSAITSYPLPNEYWTRPIEGQNTDWWSISSNWLNEPHIRDEPGGRYQMDGVAPNSAHIMWTKPIHMGGVVGGTNVGPNDGQMFYTGSNYDVIIEDPIIMYGRFYYPLPLGTASSGGGYQCVDLRTGEEIWWKPISPPSFGQVFDYNHPNQHGAPGGFLWATVGRGAGQTWNATDPWNGETVIGITDIPSGYDVYGPNGEILRYVIDSDGKWLALWNTTQLLGSGAPGRRGSYPSEFNGTEGYSWNLTVPNLPAGDWSIERAFYGDLLLLVQGTFGTRTHASQSTESSGANVTAISLKDANMGAILWTKYYPVPEGDVYREMSAVDPVNRVIIFRDKETLNLWGYSLDNGNKLWGPVQQSSSPWDYFHASLYTYAAYDNLYTAGMDGVIECFDIKTGTLKWTYGNGGPGNSTNGGLNSPFGNYPIQIGAIADGKLYTFVFEHTADSPIYKGYTVRCIDAYDGAEMWQLDSFVTAGGGGARGALWPSFAIADGYLVYLNGYDMQLYCVGRGPSVTQVSAPDVAAAFGAPVVIRGTVMDIAAGTMRDEQVARFPNGVAAVSDESMRDWMQYVYMQKPKPADVVGVTVSIDVIDSNGNYRNVGSAETDASGFFSFAWTPDIPGGYKVIATFAGTHSYWPSYAESSFVVMEALPPPEPTPEPILLPPFEMYILYATIAIIAAVAVVGVLLLRKR